MNRVQVVLSGFSMILFCFVQIQLYVGMVVCFVGCTRACVCGCDVVCVGHDIHDRMKWIRNGSKIIL